MFVRISGPSDAVALAVSLAGHLPESELAVIVLDQNSRVPALAMAKIGDPSEDEAVGLLEGLESMPFLDDGASFLVVMFGSAEQARMASGVVDMFRAGTRVFSYTEGLARIWYAPGVAVPAEGQALDLAAHPLVTEAVVSGQLRLLTRTEIRASFAPAQFGAEQVAQVQAVMGREQLLLAAMGSREAARRAFETAIVPYLDTERGITVTTEHAGMVAAALLDVPVRDLLMAEFTTERVRAVSEVCRQVGASLDGAQAAPAIIFGAICAWVARQPATAREALNVGLELDPEHRFGRLIEQGLDHGLHPDTWEQLRTAAADARQHAE